MTSKSVSSLVSNALLQRLLSGWFILASTLVFFVLGVQAATAQGLQAEAVAERERDYGRLTLTFRDRLDLPPYEVTAENGVLRIVFEDAVETDIRDSMRTLADFVTIARQDPDGRALRFGLARAVRINTMEAGEVLFIDFLPATWQGFPPPLPAEIVQRLAERAEQAAREAAEAERRRLLGELEPEVELQVGRSANFVRYSMNWNVPFNVAVEQSGPQLRMEFDYDVPIDLQPAFIDQPEELEDISFERDGASLAVTMDVLPGTGLRWFQDEQRFIVDMEVRNRSSDMAADDAQADIDRALARLQPQAAPGSSQFSAVGARDIEDVVLPEEAQTSADRVTELDASGADLAGEQPDMADMDPAASDGSPQEPNVAVQPDPLANNPNGRAPEVSFNTMDDTPDTVRVEVRQEENGSRLVFPFTASTPAAAIRRENHITLVFQTRVPLDLRSVRSELSDKVRSVQPIQINDLSIVHMELREDALLSMAPSGDRWIVLLGSTILEPPQGLVTDRGTLPDGKAYVEVAAGGFGEPHSFVHPHVGDTLHVVPMTGPARGMLSRQSFVEFDLLPTAHGIVVRPKTDGLDISIEDETVRISQENGLALSELGLSLGTMGFSPDERPGYFDLRAYAGEGASGFADRFSDYQTAISSSNGAVRTEQLLDFSRFLLAFELGQEANGALDLALSGAPALEHDPAYLTIRSAALTFADRYRDAKDVVSSHALSEVEDARVWELLIDGELGNWADLNANFDDVALLFDGYPRALVARARLNGVEAALMVNDIEMADARLTQVDPLQMSDAELKARFDLLRGRVRLAKGRALEALEIFDELQANDLGPIGAEATLAAIDARLDIGQIDLDEGLDRLENLAVAWRGDNTEVETRRRLADLYVTQGSYSQALVALKGILVAQPEHRDAADISDQMQDVFVDLFLNGEADQMEAIDALSLFYDFRELTPIGRRGDELVRRLSDRLVSMDLLDQAADLLQHQVDNRLNGTARAQIAADLALIYLMDYRPTEAVAVLQRTRVTQVPQIIERGRRVIEARALSELGREQLALEILREFDGTDIDTVRADVLWSAERWDDAGSTLERMLADRWRDQVPLDEDEMHQVLRAAIAFSFAGDDFALQRLRARYDGKMSDGVFASAFDVVTSPIESHGSAFRDVARSISGLNTLNRFLADYRASFSSQPLTPAVPSGA